MKKRKVNETHKGDKRSPHRKAVNQVINQQDYEGRSLPDHRRIKAATVLHRNPGDQGDKESSG
jgi:hypothetical protein